LIYYRDPLLDKICDRIFGLAEPAFIKNSALVYVAVNDAYAQLFNASVSDLVGTGRGDHEEIEAVLGIEDKERACLVFGEEQAAAFSHPFGKGQFRVELERFTLADSQTFLYGVFAPLKVPEKAAVAEAPAAPQPTGVPNPVTMPGGDLDKQQLEQLTDELDVGLCIWSADQKLVFFNERLRSYYEGFIDPMYLGMDLRDSLSMAYDGLARLHPDTISMAPEVKQRIIDDKIASYMAERSSEYSQLPSGRWLRVINRRQPDGSVFGLRLDVTDIKKRELLLEEHIEHVSLYRELLNRLPVAAFVRGPDKKLAFLNQAYADFFGRSYDDLMGTDVDTLLAADPDYAHKADLANIRTLETGEENSYEEDVPLAQGQTARSIVKIGRLISAKGTPFIVGTLVDISSIRQRELQLKEAIELAEAARQDIENIISSVDIGLVVLDRGLNIQLMNNAYKRLVVGESESIDMPDMIGRPLRDLMYENFVNGRHPASAETFDSYYDRRVANIVGGRIEASETQLVNGVSLLYSSLPLSGGRTLLCYVDLTELRKRDQQVAAAHQDAEKALQLVRTATDMMPEGLMVLDGETIVFANGSFAELFRVPDDLVRSGARWEDLFRATVAPGRGLSSDEVETSVARFRAALLTKKNIAYTIPLDDERWVHLEMRTAANGQAVVICSDETLVMRREAELKQLVAKAEAADRAKSEFLANMTLEIRTPMNGILGMAEMLSKSYLDTRQRAFTDIIVKSGKTLLTFINDILDYSSLDAGNLELKHLPFDPHEAIEDVVSLFSFNAAEKNLELIVRQTEGVPRKVLGDAARFRRILSSLIGNAVKFTEHGHVIVTSRVANDEHGRPTLGISIEDTGRGISRDMLGKIFEKFAQREGSVSRREGTGLGLAIAQRLAQLLGGAIEVESTEAKGSTFTFSLPLDAVEENAWLNPLPAIVAGARILIVDDHAVARTHMIEQVAHWGFECIGAGDAATALSILDVAAENAVHVDVLVIDSQMPDMDLNRFVKQIRADARLAALSIITLNTRDFGSGGDLVNDPNVQAYLAKPVRAALLRDTLVEVIRTARTPRQLLSEASVFALRPGASIANPCDQTAANSADPSVNRTGTKARRPYILVAEDNEVNRMFFSQMLEAGGYAFTIVQNGEDALEAWHREQPMMVLMDTTMPVLDGFEATQRIRAIEAMTGGHTPIIGVITHRQDSEGDLCLSSGMDDYIVKPVHPERLEEKIRHWLGQDIPSLAGSSERA